MTTEVPQFNQDPSQISPEQRGPILSAIDRSYLDGELDIETYQRIRSQYEVDFSRVFTRSATFGHFVQSLCNFLRR